MFRVYSRIILLFVMLASSLWFSVSTTSASETICKKFDTGDKVVEPGRKWFVRAIGTIDESGKIEGCVITKCDEPLWGFSAASKLRLLGSNQVPVTKDMLLNSHGVNARWIPGYTSVRVDTFKEMADANAYALFTSSDLVPVYGSGHSEMKRRIDFLGKTLSIYWYLLFFALSVGCISTFLDLYSFFGYRGTALMILCDVPSFLFMVCNGLLAAIFVYLALESKNGDINGLMPAGASEFTKTLIISFGVPIILKSKLFNYGDERKPVGLVMIYDFLLDNVKDRLSGKIVDDVSGAVRICDGLLKVHPELPEALSKYVESLSEFKPEEDRLELARKLSDLNKECEKNGIERLVRFSAKTIGVQNLKKWLKINYSK